ncbi:T. brucei spp.-specific protein [Trypanosoma brucei gambiense DAL972]|uniref:T. brucei spp.-specific protein n=1 Tax=Trypanosoma brucei gambiense (strain MHOM/CI/86/DAL972) TaxID=679716 RepID=C9ZNM9_TRYB9|nr:T. brucei spp.-specific protein [Trypanosoma brucei gambiense DAL972]CBH11007.1 T. brucei spp.-specific protein [Trypanosoma brucei gambiense DAL972]|eukprot:XP_011773294.1 T. brucei spp.-specific protein [Trypanosoma brucei gambiense DAL972]
MRVEMSFGFLQLSLYPHPFTHLCTLSCLVSSFSFIFLCCRFLLFGHPFLSHFDTTSTIPAKMGLFTVKISLCFPDSHPCYHCLFGHNRNNSKKYCWSLL